MKTYNNARILMILVPLFALISAKAEIKTLFIQHKDGIEPIMLSEIESIRLTNLDADGVRHDAPVYQEFCTSDTVYRFFIGDIEKVSFEPLPTIPLPTAIDLAGEMAPYIESVDYERNIIQLKSALPSHLSLNWDTGLYQIYPSENVPYGFAGKVSYVNDNIIYCDDCELNEIFESLDITDQLDISIESQQAPGVSGFGDIPWYAAECHVPDNTVNIMTDELKDIPVGKAQPYVDCKVRIQPVIACQRGIYVLPSSIPGEKARSIHRMKSAVKLNVEVLANGRCILEDQGDKEESGNMGDGVTLKNKPLGLGKKFTAKFKGTAKAKGSMGVDHGYSASYLASASSAVYEDPEKIAVASLAQRCNVVTPPAHTLDASLTGSLSVSGSITMTITGVADSLKSISQVYTFGSKLSGDAFYKSSDIDSAHDNNALYERLTSSGVEATPIESITAAIKYASETLKNSNKVTPTPATAYYAVPKFSTPVYANGELSYPIEGVPMKSVKSSLGSAVKSSSGSYKFNNTPHCWPGVTTFNSSPVFSVSDGDIVYPTATLQGKTILCSPSYPGFSAGFTPIITYMRNPGIRIVSGWPYFATGTKGSTVVIEGTPPGWMHKEEE